MRKTSANKFAFIAIVIAMTATSFSKDASSQGLKGAPPNVHFGQIDMIDGRNDDERWKKLLSIEKNLIGMSSGQVAKILGDVRHNKGYMLYGITESNTSKKGEIAHITLEITLQHDRVESFKIAATRWVN